MFDAPISKWKYASSYLVPFAGFELLTHSQPGLVFGGVAAFMLLKFGPRNLDVQSIVGRFTHRPTEPEVVADGVLHLSEDYSPHANDILGRGLLCVGQRGAGKSSAAARLIEQLGPYTLPVVVIDYKMDYITLAQSVKDCVIAGSPEWTDSSKYGDYWDIDAKNAHDAGYDVMMQGKKLILQAVSYGSLDTAAEVITSLVQGCLDFAKYELPAGEKIPSLILLDEAQQFLPQNSAVSPINSDLSAKLMSVFEQVNSVGRSLGLTPAFFTQRIAQIRKECIGGSEIFWLMKQSQPVDLDVYENLLGKGTVERSTIQGLRSGDAIIFENGNLDCVMFYQRESKHLSVTPKLEDAQKFYSTRQDIATTRKTPITDGNLDAVTVKSTPAPVIPEQGRKAEDVDLSTAINVWNSLHPSVRDMMQIFGLTNHQAQKLRKIIFSQAEAEQPELEEAE